MLMLKNTLGLYSGNRVRIIAGDVLG